MKLQVSEDKSSFFIGSPIELELTFANPTADAYMLNDTQYGDIADKVEITPENGWVQWQGRSGHDFARMTELHSTPLSIPILLNEGFVFRTPGHYQVRVTTSRLERGANLSQLVPCGPMTTNAVAIDLVSLPADVEAKEVSRLVDEIDDADTQTPAGTKAHRKAIAKLASLQGDEALRAKMHLIAAEDDDMRAVTREALASTRNLLLQLSLLKDLWKDPAIPPAYDVPNAFEETRALMRKQTLPGFVMSMPTPDATQAAKEQEEHRSDMEDLLSSLAMRSGQSRATAAFYLMQDRSLSPADVASAKPVALQEFASMSELEQHMLLEGSWAAFRDPSLMPALRTMLERSPTDSITLQRLIDLDPNGAKQFVIRAVCDRHSTPSFESVAALPDKSLPEVDGCLGNLLRTPPPTPEDLNWRMRAELAARFASPAIIPAARQGWTSRVQDSAALPLFVRYAPGEAASRIEASKENSSVLFYETNLVFKAMQAPLPDQLLSLLRHQVQEGTGDKARTAAYELSQFGAPEDRDLLEQALANIRKEWSSRQNDSAESQQLEIELMSDLRHSSLWSLTDPELEQLALGCGSDVCKEYGKPRKEQPSN